MSWHGEISAESEERVRAALTIDVSEPPCKQCKHWNPRYLVRDDGTIAGVRFCHAEEMFDDFSCYEDW